MSLVFFARPGSYVQGEKTEIPLGLLDKVQPSGDTILILGNSEEPDFKDIQLETSSFEELSLLTVGFQEMLKSVRFCPPLGLFAFCIHKLTRRHYPAARTQFSPSSEEVLLRPKTTRTKISLFPHQSMRCAGSATTSYSTHILILSS